MFDSQKVCDKHLVQYMNIMLDTIHSPDHHGGPMVIIPAQYSKGARFNPTAVANMKSNNKFSM
jgi:hypothetical protein